MSDVKGRVSLEFQVSCSDDLCLETLYRSLKPEIENPENRRLGIFAIEETARNIKVRARLVKFSDAIAVTNSLLGLLHVAFGALHERDGDFKEE